MMGGYGDVQLLNDDGSRLDGRKVDEMREVTIEAGVLPAADGSAMVTPVSYTHLTLPTKA